MPAVHSKPDPKGLSDVLRKHGLGAAFAPLDSRCQNVFVASGLVHRC